MADVFSADELAGLALELDRQLAVVRSREVAVSKNGMDEVRALKVQLQAQLEPEKAAITAATQEDADGFLKRFARVAKRDVCEEGGLLNQQWKLYQDLSRSDTVKVVGGVLAGMGIANPTIATIVLPIGVILTHLTLRTFCEEYGEKDQG
jgi:hypothetical protein